MKTIVQITLAVIIVVLSYLTYESIQKPIRFQAEKEIRYGKTIQRLKDIRTAQLAYKDVYGEFAPNFEKLIFFLKSDSMSVVRAIGTIPEELLDSISEEEAVKRGMIVRDTINVSALDSLFGKTYIVDSIKYVPFTKGVMFNLANGSIETAAKVKVQIFEASALNKDILNGLNEELIVTEGMGKDFKGLKVGSLTEANGNAGNWE